MTKTHEIKLDGYGAHTTLAEDRPIMLLGTAESYGIETLHVVSGKSWEGLTVTATFNAPDGTSTDMLMDADGSITVPPEATSKSGSGKIVFTGVSNGIQRISCDLEYFVVAHSAINGVQSGGTAPSWFEQAATRFMPTGGTVGQVLTKLTDADFDAKWQDSKGGADGKSAYSYAVEGGYTGTEAEFAAKLAAEGLDKALFVVNITPNADGTYSADKTFEEIAQVYNEGKYNIVANFAVNAMNTFIVPFLAITGAGAAFGGVIDLAYSTFLITPNNGVETEMLPLATENSKLPNPYPLTFTGAVNETYDGSSAKTITIPSGGGAHEGIYSLLVEHTITEDVSEVVYTNEEYPGIANLKHILVSIIFPEKQTTGWWKVVAGDVPIMSTAGVSNAKHYYGAADVKCGHWIWSGDGSNNDAAGQRLSPPSVAFNPIIGFVPTVYNDYSSLRIYGSSFTLTAGTVVRIWGCE